MNRSSRNEEDSEVLVNRIGDEAILMQKKNVWESVINGLSMFTDDFLTEEIGDLPLQEREWL